MNITKLLTVASLLFVSLISYGQVVKGTVKDGTTKEPLLGVNILVKGTKTGTNTDFDGNFQIKASKGSILEFTFMGFKTREIKVTGENLMVEMFEEAQVLEDVVVIGYGVAKKKDVTGSVNLVTTKDFNQGQNLGADQLIQGKVAGVQVTSGGGAPGDGQTIRIRGTGSLTLSSNPLVVIDGVPMNDGGVGGSRGIFSAINPEDVESMTVLKDASSTAIYGSRASNGVIMIVTKKGKANQETKVSVNSSLSISEVSNYLDLLSAGRFRELIQKTGTANQIAKLGTADTDWQKQIYQLAPTSSTTVSVTGNLKSLPYRFSLGHTYAEGTLKTDNFKRGTAKLSLTPSFLDNSLKTEVNVSGFYSKNRFADKGAIGAAVEYDPTQPVFSNGDKYGGYHTWLNAASGTKSTTAPSNPMAILKYIDDRSEVKQVISNVKVDYTIPSFKELTLTANAGIDYSRGEGGKDIDKNMQNPSPDYNGFTESYKNEATNKLLDLYANYMKEINKHSISLMVGHSYQQFYFKNDSNSTEMYLDESKNINKINIDRSRNTLLSFFGRMNYSFDERYMLTATLRADASSKLNPDDRWGYFPSVALAWNVKNENFLKTNNLVNEIKVRLGYGEVGNVNGLGDYLFLTRYVQSINKGAYYQFGNQFYSTYRPESLNKNLRWEVGNTINVGLDFGLWENRISGSIDAYKKITKDLIAESNVAPFTNYGSRISSNIGDMENQGVEVVLNVVPVRNDKVKWNVSYNIAYNHNEITKLTNIQNVGGISGGTGTNIQRHREGETPFSFYLYEQVYDANGKAIEGAYVDRNNDGKITEDDRYFCHSPYADITMGLTTTLTYGKWDLNIGTRASLNNYIYDNVASANATLDRIYSDDILRNVTDSYFDANFKARTIQSLQSDYYLHNASFFKIDNITLGYTIPKDKFGVRIYGSVQNPLVVTKYKGLDPEVFGGIDNNFYPRPRIYMFGVNLEF